MYRNRIKQALSTLYDVGEGKRPVVNESIQSCRKGDRGLCLQTDQDIVEPR